MTFNLSVVEVDLEDAAVASLLSEMAEAVSVVDLAGCGCGCGCGCYDGPL